VLISDVWHPLLSEDERDAIRQLDAWAHAQRASGALEKETTATSH
jgi:hypothetical protein